MKLPPGAKPYIEWLVEQGLDPEVLRVNKHAVAEVGPAGRRFRITIPLSASDRRSLMNWKAQIRRRL